jgi:hypothetical protein
MFAFTQRVPFGGVWGWHRGLGHPILKVFGLIVALFLTVLLVAVALVALVIDIVLLPFRLLF